jgi:hypothetical protein
MFAFAYFIKSCIDIVDLQFDGLHGMNNDSSLSLIEVKLIWFQHPKCDSSNKLIFKDLDMAKMFSKELTGSYLLFCKIRKTR